MSEDCTKVADNPNQNGAATNGIVTRNKRMCRRKASYKDDFASKTANQIKSLRLKSTSRNSRLPKLPKHPCKSGTNVVVKGKVLQEEPEGLLVMTIQWRGKEYCGCFIETNKQGWALPRFDDPKVTSIAFLNKKAMLLNSDPEDTTDDDYSPKTKRRKATKNKNKKKRKIKNGDISNGKTVKTPTKSKAGRPSNAEKMLRRQSVDSTLERNESSNKKTLVQDQTENSSVQQNPPYQEKFKLDNEKSVNVELKCNNNIMDIVPPDNVKLKSEEKSVNIKSSPQKFETIVKCSTPVVKQIRTEKTVTIPVGSIPSSPASSTTHTILPTSRTNPIGTSLPTHSSPKMLSPFKSSQQTNGALVSPLHNHTFPPIVPPPFFIPNFLQSAKFLAGGVKRSPSSDAPSVIKNDFGSSLSKTSPSVLRTTDAVLPVPAQNVIISSINESNKIQNK